MNQCIVDLTNTDWKLLHQQKDKVVRLASAWDAKDQEHLDGIIHFLDYIQDEAAKQIGENIVFGKEEEE